MKINELSATQVKGWTVNLRKTELTEIKLEVNKFSTINPKAG